jgi:hypothetical protein
MEQLRREVEGSNIVVLTNDVRATSWNQDEQTVKVR